MAGMIKKFFSSKKRIILIPLTIFIIILFYIFFKISSLSGRFIEIKQSKQNKTSYKVEIVDKKPKNWVNLNQVEKKAVDAIVIAEDWAFKDHHGIDFSQIREAIKESLLGKRKKIRGASTITQQVVKNIFFTSERSYIRKIKEVLYAIFLEQKLEKEKIKEIYINIAEFGPGIYGIKNASWYYFKKNPKYLSPKEGAFLAMLLPSPKRYGESFRKKKLTAFAKRRINQILKNMALARKIKKNQLASIISRPLSWEKVESPKEENPAMTEDREKYTNREHDDSKGSKIRFSNDLEIQIEENPEFEENAPLEDFNEPEAEFSVQE